MKLGLSGKNCLITGAAQGIGKGIAQALAEEGANICISDINEELGKKAIEEIKAFDCKSLFIQTDISSEKQVANMFEHIEDQLGTIDILINNAGISPKTHLFDSIPFDEFEEVISINLIGSYLCSKYAYHHMKEKGWGRIINMSSSAAIYGANVAGVHYAASKGGIISLTKTLSKKMGSYGITVNCVSPGRINTPLTKNTPLDVESKIIQQISLRRNGEIAEVASAVVFLASDAASYLTGINIEVTGGWTA